MVGGRMNEPEIRGHFVLHEGLNILPAGEWESQTQQAISWCTFHDFPDTFKGKSPMCWKAKAPFTDCVWSTGGLEHKWWVDV